MSGTVTNFTPTSAAPFQFDATLDGTAYVCTVTWGLWDQRWYLNVYTTANEIVLVTPLIDSIPSVPINLVFGFFQTSAMVFYDASQTIVVTP
jgi:hypothetical protein